MKIVMLGAGALGSTIGGTLAIGGNDVHFVDMWQEHVDLINKDGLHMTNEKRRLVCQGGRKNNCRYDR